MGHKAPVTAVANQHSYRSSGKGVSRKHFNYP
jgi:hypothetical protein